MEQVSNEKLLRKSLGAMLIEANLVSSLEWENAAGLHQGDGYSVGQILVDNKSISSQQLAVFTSLQSGMPFIGLKRQKFDTELLSRIPERIARQYQAIPLEIKGETLVMAMADPKNVEAIKDLEILTRLKIEPMLSILQDILEAIDSNYRASAEIEKQLSQIPVHSQRSFSQETRVSAEAVAGAPIVRALDLLIAQAVRDRASDLHLEPQEDRLRVRNRIDGILHEVMSLPLNVYPSMISRIKIMAGMNIAERRRPQDGQITFHIGEKEIDIRAAISNTVHGEMAVLRLLDKTFAFRPLPQLGFLPDSLEKYRRMLKSPFGMILISGPTGSGKTTTLYASVNQLDSVATNILTIEDPVEYRFKNISQMQVNPGAGFTFASGLRASMRLDPDTILVGEIRDSETAQIAVQAALTGHLVMSSVHANDTAGVIFRLIDLGIEPFLIASALVGIVAQRMVRCICPRCARLIQTTADEYLAYEREMGEARQEFLYGSGCNFCANTGYQGRTGIYEVMIITEEIRRLILSGGGKDEIHATSVKEGLVSLWRDGMIKIGMGITTPFEVIRNVFSVA
ncbi:MAG: ATPase, T2SS/T4P/T4SS family [Dehalococcoidia bacterium]|nr:ATPase, T2SS/T4P/T4SS family [Dehalococcoidia bacterium]